MGGGEYFQHSHLSEDIQYILEKLIAEADNTPRCLISRKRVEGLLRENSE
jgi:hypothetical protein